MKTKQEYITEVLDNPVYLPGSGLYKNLAAVLGRLPLRQLEYLAMLAGFARDRAAAEALAAQALTGQAKVGGTRLYVVYREEYTRGMGGDVELKVVWAASPAALVRDLEDWTEDSDAEVCEHFAAANGDGMDFYVIRELDPATLTLAEVPELEWQAAEENSAE